MTEPRLKLHENKIAALNSKAEPLLLEMARAPDDFSRPEGGFSPPYHSVGTIPAALIQNLEVGEVDPGGRRLSRYFEHEDKYVGLGEEGFKKFALLTEEIQRTKELRTLITLKTVEDTVFSWMIGRYTGAVTSPLMEYLIPRLEEEVDEYEVWIPIAEMSVENDALIGAVLFRCITEERLRELFPRPDCMSEDEERRFNAYFFDYQARIQGLAAATLRLTAEPQRAIEIAYEETEKALAVLSFYSAAAFLPGAVFYCAPLGLEYIEKRQCAVRSERGRYQWKNGLQSEKLTRWLLSDAYLQEANAAGLGFIQALLAAPSASKFQKELLEAFLLYTKHARAHTVSDKLIYVFVALDSFLLSSQSESNIQQNVARRLAFVVGQNGRERKTIKDQVVRAYEMRSDYIHHAVSVQESEALHEFLVLVWQFFLTLFQRSHEYRDRKDFINQLDEKVWEF
jgi:hypothetical protein